MNNPKRMNVKQLTYIGKIAKANFARVEHYRNTDTHEEYAVKTPHGDDERHLRLTNNEKFILNQLDHPNIVKYYGYCFITTLPSIVMELMATTLEQVLLDDYLLNDEIDYDAKERHLQVACGLIYGLKYLHTEKMIGHFDLKPANILTDEKCTQVKICDFGISTDLKDTTTPMKWDKGSPSWISPECAAYALTKKNKPSDPYKPDVWTAGQIFLQLYINTLAEPYLNIPDDPRLFGLFSAIAKGEHDPIPPNKPLTEIITWCLKKDPAERWSTTQVADALEKLKSAEARPVSAIVDVSESMEKLKLSPRKK